MIKLKDILLENKYSKKFQSLIELGFKLEPALDDFTRKVVGSRLNPKVEEYVHAKYFIDKNNFIDIIINPNGNFQGTIKVNKRAVRQYGKIPTGNLQSVKNNYYIKIITNAINSMNSETNLSEKKKKKKAKRDKCYYKVKRRYKVWPSAYGSLALSACRKVGADVWGEKSKGN